MNGGERQVRPFSAEGRCGNLEEMAARGVDVLVVGGGITGVGVALEATRRGHQVGLVEAHDFAWGTSSRSSKMVHGGLRYLAHGEVGLVREALQERHRLAREFPELVAPLSFLLPIPRNRREALSLKIGLIMYDALARGSGFPGHRRVSVAEARRLAPALLNVEMPGAWVYWDAQTDDARLTLTAARRAAAGGALVANHVEMLRARHENDGGWQVTLVDRVQGGEVTVQARVLVNATGVWADGVEAASGEPPRAHLRPSKGVHLSFSADVLPIETALVFPIGDGRLLFAVPWKGHVLVGTTDDDYHGNLSEPTCNPAEAAEVLSAVNRFFGLTLGEDSILSRWAGVRPLVAAGAGATKDLSRRPFIEIDQRGLLTVTGGKLTTFMRMAQRAVDLVDGFGGGPRANGPAHPAEANRLPDAEQPAGADAAVAVGGGYTLDDVDRAVDEEMAIELDDVLSRRLRLSFVDAAAALAAAPAVAERMSAHLGWPDVDARVAAFTLQLQREFGLPV